MKKPTGFKKWILACLLLTFSISSSGCFYLVLGGVAAAGGYAVSADTIQGETDKDAREVWNSAVDIISILGIITAQNRGLGKIAAVVNGAKVTVNVLTVTQSVVQLKVKARKAFFPSIANAQTVYVKIMNRVSGSER